MYQVDMSKLPIEKQNWFCAEWDTIATGIKAISAVSKNIFVIGACAIVLAVGNVVKSKICS